MPRTARIKSVSGFYHVLLRGIGKQNIFEDDKDRQHFIETLERYKAELKFEIHAYCLMGNHVHILLKDADQRLDLIMKKIAGSYAWHFNWKYERVGHFFQDRFKSEPIEDEKYYLTALRYIHQNPQKADIALVNEYEWSSYCEYVDSPKIVNTEFALDIIGGKDAFISFMEENEEDLCLEVTDKTRLTDAAAIALIKEMAKVKNVQQLQSLEAASRDKILAELKCQGLSIRQIARLTGVNRGVVLKA